MKFTIIIIFFLSTIFQVGYTKKYHFPESHYAHTGYQTEWWYYTGHLISKDKKFGYELVFFKIEWPKHNNVNSWKAKPIYMAHFAISDIENKYFFFDEKINRPIGNIAGAKTTSYFIWNENWKIKFDGKFHYLKAKSKHHSINLKLKPLKKPISHGLNNISLKGKEKNNFSHYYSITRLSTKGTITINKKIFHCTGISWMDHEWMNNRLSNRKIPRWDWFSIQLDNEIDIMFYILKTTNNKINPFSSGTIIYKNNIKKHLDLSNIEFNILNYWTSKKSKITYPIKWQIKLKKENLNLIITPFFKQQELILKFSKIIYWEGASKVSGNWNKKIIKGKAYVEMAGYDINRELNNKLNYLIR